MGGVSLLCMRGTVSRRKRRFQLCKFFRVERKMSGRELMLFRSLLVLTACGVWKGANSTTEIPLSTTTDMGATSNATTTGLIESTATKTIASTISQDRMSSMITEVRTTNVKAANLPSDPESNNTYVIIGGSVGGAVMLAVVLSMTILLVVICIKKRAKKKKGDGHFCTGRPTKSMARNPTSQRALITTNEDLKERDDELQRLKPIPISEFSEVVKRKHFNANIAFEDEFESFPTIHPSSYEAAKQKYNTSKNRFENIFPYDFTRVVLKQLRREEPTDYINSSFIDGYQRENAYIAAQGPLRSTIADFWRMIWEYKLAAIIMLTETNEAGKEKCTQYWPALLKTPWEVGDGIAVAVQSQTQYASYRLKRITVNNMDEPDEKSLTVTHFHYSAWPDHGVPADKTCLIQFIQMIRKDFPYYETPPLLVHCSAGVGRSGTFIVLDSMLERMKKENSFNIYSFITEMRKKRGLMVQTEPQYSFVHDALDEYITCGDTSIVATNIRVTMVTLNKRDSSGKCGYTTQFELLDKVSYKQTAMNCNEAEKEYNVEKNRYKEHVPYNINRVCLRPGGSKGQDYINASFVNGYKHRKNFIATQGPTKETVNEFWRMVWEHKCRVIVMLCNLEEDEEESCCKYWPGTLNKTDVYGKYKIKMLREEENSLFIMRKFEIGEDSPYMAPGNPDAVYVTQFHHTKWPKQGAMPSSSSILEMINSLLKVQRSTGNHAIIVMCNNGIGRTGTFTTIYSQIERIKAEQVADFFQFIKGCRFQRAGIVSDVAQFQFCHQVLADYLNSVDNYANFKDL